MAFNNNFSAFDHSTMQCLTSSFNAERFLDPSIAWFGKPMNFHSSQTDLEGDVVMQNQADCTKIKTIMKDRPTFMSLPAQFRQHIWALAMPAPRTHYLEIYGHCVSGEVPKIRYIPPLPSLFHVNHESRTLSIQNGGGTLIRFHDDYNRSFYFNVTADVLFLSSRFLYEEPSTETTRMHILGRILDYRDAARVQRIAVTYAAHGDYSRIGPTFRPFASLRDWYLAMTDRYSPAMIKWDVSNGRPGVGVEAGKIRAWVERTEAEETDDEEESEEQEAERHANSARRRIVEVELRLGDYPREG